MANLPLIPQNQSSSNGRFTLWDIFNAGLVAAVVFPPLFILTQSFLFGSIASGVISMLVVEAVYSLKMWLLERHNKNNKV